jgi:hypothetical protein
MISNLFILAEGTKDTLFTGIGTILLLVYAFVIVLIIVAAVIFIRFLSSGMREMKLMRIEVGKLAEELRLLRNNFIERKKTGSPKK